MKVLWKKKNHLVIGPITLAPGVNSVDKVTFEKTLKSFDGHAILGHFAETGALEILEEKSAPAPAAPEMEEDESEFVETPKPKGKGKK